MFNLWYMILLIFPTPITPELNFNWLPAGVYNLIKYSDFEKTSVSPFFSVFDESLSRSWSAGGDSSIAEPLRAAVTQQITALLFPDSRIFADLDDDSADPAEGEDKTAPQADVNELSSLFVLTMDDVAGTMRQAVDAGVARESGQKILRKPVWRFPRAAPGEKERSVWAWDTGSGELLVADTLPLLRQMVAAGSGRGPSIVDDPDLHDHLSRIPPEATRWFYRSYAAIWERTVEDFREQGEQGKAEQLKEIYAAKPQYELAWFEFRADGLLQVRAWGFADSEPAERFVESLRTTHGGERHPTGYPEAAIAFSDALRQKTSYRIDGALAIWETFYDETVLARMGAAREALKTWRAEQEKKEKAKEESKGKTEPPARNQRLP